MTVIPLGVNGPYPAAGGACSSYLVRGGGAELLLDAGAGALSLVQGIVSLDALDAVALSHLHFDHISDALVLQYARARLTPGVPLPLFLPDEPADIAALFDGGVFKKTFIQPNTAYRVKEMTITFREVTHPVKAYAAIIQADGRTLAYSGDTVYTGMLAEYFSGADALLLDACVLQREQLKNAPHMTAFEAGALAASCGVRAYLTHLNPAHDPADVLAEARVRHSKDIFLAKPLEAIEV